MVDGGTIFTSNYVKHLPSAHKLPVSHLLMQLLAVVKRYSEFASESHTFSSCGDKELYKQNCS